MSTWAKQNNGNYLNPITGYWWKKEGDKWQLYEEYGRYKIISVSEEDFKEIEKQLVGGGGDARLRDEFAMAALPECASEHRYKNDNGETVAREAYMFADAMLKERKKNEQ